MRSNNDAVVQVQPQPEQRGRSLPVVLSSAASAAASASGSSSALSLSSSAASSSSTSPGSLSRDSSVSSPMFSSPSAANWSVGDVCLLLESLCLGLYAPRFEASLIDGEALLELSEEDLVDLGVADKFHRRKLAKKIRNINEQTTTTLTPNASATAAATPSVAAASVVAVDMYTSKMHVSVHGASSSSSSSSSMPPPARAMSRSVSQQVPSSSSSSSSVSSSSHLPPGVTSPMARAHSSSAASSAASSSSSSAARTMAAAAAAAASASSSSPAAVTRSDAHRRLLLANAGGGAAATTSSEDEEDSLLLNSTGGSSLNTTGGSATQHAGAADTTDSATDSSDGPLYISNVEVEHMLQKLPLPSHQLQQRQQQQHRTAQRGSAADGVVSLLPLVAASSSSSASASVSSHSIGHRSHHHPHKSKRGGGNKSKALTPAKDASADHYHDWVAAEDAPAPPFPLPREPRDQPTIAQMKQQHSQPMNMTMNMSTDVPTLPLMVPFSSSSSTEMASTATTMATMDHEHEHEHGPTIASLPAPSPSPSLTPLMAAVAAATAAAVASSTGGSGAAPSHLVLINLAEIACLRHLDQGSAGVAYVGVYRGRAVVVKAPKKAIVGAEEWSELQLHLKIPPHDNLVAFLGICMVQTTMYFVTEFVPRGSLKSLLSPSPAAASSGSTAAAAMAWKSYYAHPLKCIEAAAEVAQGLLHLHRHHVVHRDVSARNVLVSAEGKHVLSDLGLSRWMEKRHVHIKPSNSQAHEAEDAAGESQYEELYSMHTLTALPARWTAPECLRSQCFGPASDVYSLGVCLWEMASGGRLPYAHVKDNLQVIAGVVLGELELEILTTSAHSAGQGTTEHPAMHFIRRCMQPVHQRPTMQQIRDEMANWIQEQREKASNNNKATQEAPMQQADTVATIAVTPI